MAYQRLGRPDIRQAAIDGLRLELRQPERWVHVRVIDENDGDLAGSVRKSLAGIHVQADLGYGFDEVRDTDAEGMAHFGLLADQQLSYLTAWADDRRIGGYSFYRDPPRDPRGTEHTIRLSPCRSQKIAILDDQERPVLGLSFLAQIATPPPQYNFIGTIEHSFQTTDATGHAQLDWFPDWPSHFFYIDLQKPQWRLMDSAPSLEDDTFVIHVQPARIAERKYIEGQLDSAGLDVAGYSVEFDSFQGERRNERDVLSTFADADGKFSLNALPDATYCIHIIDSKHVSEIIDMIPYQSASGLISSPIIQVQEGNEIQVLVTSGPNNQPIPHLSVDFRHEHSFTWREGMEIRNGTGGYQRFKQTDTSGRASVRAVKGKLFANIRTPFWKLETKIEVHEGTNPIVELHREVDEP